MSSASSRFREHSQEQDPASRVEAKAISSAKNVPHVLFLIDHLMARGGGEGNLLKLVELLPPDLVRCSVATFSIHPDILKTIKVPVHVFPLRRVYNLSGIKAAIRLRKLIRDERIDIVQTYFETSNLWGGLVAKLSGARLLSSRRDLGILRSTKHRLAYLLVNRLSDRVLAVSGEVKKFCVEQDRIDPEKVAVVYNGVDLKQIADTLKQTSAFSSAEWAGASHIVTCVANLRRVKGIDVLLRAAQRVCRELPDAMFLIAGSLYEQGYAEEVLAMSRELRLESNVKFLEFVDDPVPLLKLSHAFCLLSRSEGFCNALLEAMACGVPSVVTRVGGNPEAIDDGHSGFLVPVEDDRAAAEKLLFLLRNPDRAAEIGEAGRRSAFSRFSADGMIQKMIALYDELMQGR